MQDADRPTAVPGKSFHVPYQRRAYDKTLEPEIRLAIRRAGVTQAVVAAEIGISEAELSCALSTAPANNRRRLYASELLAVLAHCPGLAQAMLRMAGHDPATVGVVSDVMGESLRVFEDFTAYTAELRVASKDGKIDPVEAHGFLAPLRQVRSEVDALIKTYEPVAKREAPPLAVAGREG